MIKIDSSHSDLLEQLTYEKFALSDLLSFLINDGIDIESEMYKKIENKYFKAFAKLEIAKRDFANFYELNEKPWKLDFNTKEIIFLNEKE